MDSFIVSFRFSGSFLKVKKTVTYPHFISNLTINNNLDEKFSATPNFHPIFSVFTLLFLGIYDINHHMHKPLPSELASSKYQDRRPGIRWYITCVARPGLNKDMLINGEATV